MQHATDQRQYRPDSLAWLSGELRDEVQFVDDRDLKGRIYQWLRDVSELPGGDVLDIVDHHLTTVRQQTGEDAEGMGEFAMRRIGGDGTENFPTSCEGCEHYGTRCPVFVDPLESDRREQLQDEHADSDTSEKRRAYRRYAEAVGCHQITGALADHVEQYQELQQRGMSLLEESDTVLGFTGDANEAARVEAEATQEGR
jgi:hypothetical protein